MSTRSKKVIVAVLILLASVLYGYTMLTRQSPWEDGVFYEVASDVISLVYYRADQDTLTLAFRSGPVYEYSSVPASVFYGLMDSHRKGSYYNQRIRGQFPSRRLELSAPGEEI
ncbi:MAG TPA: KTSC domain-containing protein [Kiritimatiellia bacterium]|nr:KTSC domain-containing protein [Kiritimatiellia bacterium]HRZ12059.1 KTSC domain-containing protein [Kiritimatiellia bacterium]HSA19610.1 KTSC domain-containing protein [Kiritimatiellia bacterium]